MRKVYVVREKIAIRVMMWPESRPRGPRRLRPSGGGDTSEMELSLPGRTMAEEIEGKAMNRPLTMWDGA
jgi:hypothetical protein